MTIYNPNPENLFPPLERAIVNSYRMASWNIRVIRGPNWPAPEGTAEISGPARCIEMRGDPQSPTWLFVFLHEIAHHVLGHSELQTTAPDWQQERAADEWALRMIRVIAPDRYYLCRAEMHNHLRPMLQARIDAGLWHNTDLDFARAIGCTIPADAPYGMLGEVTTLRVMSHDEAMQRVMDDMLGGQELLCRESPPDQGA